MDRAKKKVEEFMVEAGQSIDQPMQQRERDPDAPEAFVASPRRWRDTRLDSNGPP